MGAKPLLSHTHNAPGRGSGDASMGYLIEFLTNPEDEATVCYRARAETPQTVAEAILFGSAHNTFVQKGYGAKGFIVRDTKGEIVARETFGWRR